MRSSTLLLRPKLSLTRVASLALFLAISQLSSAQDATLAPFETGAESNLAGKLKASPQKSQTIECLSSGHLGEWEVENPSEEKNSSAFTLREEGGKDALSLTTSGFIPGMTTVRVLLPGDGPGNGDVWARNHANYISFKCKSTGSAKMTLNLLVRGKTSGTYRAVFSAKPGDWQQWVLPIQAFGLENFAHVAGLGFRVLSADQNAEVFIADIQVGTSAYTDESWKGRQLNISLKGDWHFAIDSGNQGMDEKWYKENYDDAHWQTLKSGLSWQEQGVSHHGYGWYRQKIIIPAEFTNVPLTLNLTKIPADDDVWFNGVRIGGWNGEYKYDNQILRSYTVPASLIRYGQPNTISLRIWGGNLTFIGDKSGLIAGPLEAELNPYQVYLRRPDGHEMPAQLFDLSDAQRGQPFDIIFRFPTELAKSPGAQLAYCLTDFNGNEIKSGEVALTSGTDHTAQAMVSVDRETAQTIYLRGRFQAGLTITDNSGNLVYCGDWKMERPSYTARDENPLPALPEQVDDTPYGRLKLVDEINCSQSLFDDPHPYLQSSFDEAQNRQTPGSPVYVTVSEILGKQARESAYGWFAYRIGRGTLKPHTTYLVRIEYPEDKPRYCPIEIQAGQNFMDVGWENGVGAEDPYDNWPLSHQWQWYDVIVPLDHKTVGTGGTGSDQTQNGVWIYFMNKIRPNSLFSIWSGGPAIARIKLYEIDPAKNAPVIQSPKDLPHRVLSFDWERQADCNPEDLVRYAKLMGYSAISPVIIKWGFANYSDPFNGYDSIAVDAHDYWVSKRYDPTSGQDATSPVPEAKSQHVRFLEATKAWGVDYIPRVEYGGSEDLSRDAWAIGLNGEPTKPNRFASWGANLLNPLTWDDMEKLMDHLIKPYVKDNPQLTGILWRSRCDRMAVSYGKADLELFSKETGTPLPSGGEAQWAAWAAGEMKPKYDDWWYEKRAQFDIKLEKLLQSYRPDLTLYYYDWDSDKFGLMNPSVTSWAFLGNVLKPGPTGGKAAYAKERAERKTFTGQDYIAAVRNGSLGFAGHPSGVNAGLNRADFGVRPDLYTNTPGIQIFAPANFLCYADKPDYLNYFQTADGLAVANSVSYDEVEARSINPKFEGSMMTPAGAPFSMALELLAYFNGDARTLNYTPYTYGRGFADAHRRFAQAFLALPAIPATVVDQGNPDLKVRLYPSSNGTYVGVAYKGYAPEKLTIKIPFTNPRATVKNLVTNETIPTRLADGELQFDIDSGPMELNAFLIE